MHVHLSFLFGVLACALSSALASAQSGGQDGLRGPTRPPRGDPPMPAIPSGAQPAYAPAVAAAPTPPASSPLEPVPPPRHPAISCGPWPHQDAMEFGALPGAGCYWSRPLASGGTGATRGGRTGQWCGPLSERRAPERYLPDSPVTTAPTAPFPGPAWYGPESVPDGPSRSRGMGAA